MKRYQEEWEPAYTPQLVMEEASRCLLCHDAPCSASCPAQTDPAKFIRSVRFRNFKGAAETIRLNNALGAICARVCPTEKYCQKACSRTGIDHPIKIGAIQRYVTDFEERTGMKVYQKAPATGKKVAVIGSGPSGLQAAASLALKGHEVVIYESRPHAGGWLRYGIPTYRLPNHVVDVEIDRIKELGVRILTNELIDNERMMNEILPHYDAVLLATGTTKGRILPLFKDNENVLSAVDLLAKIKENDGEVDIPNNALIVGGGDVAMDIATSLKALGTQNVTVVAREEMEVFPASKEEYEVAHAANVSIIDGYTPIAVHENVVEFEHVKLANRLTITADLIILACGQSSSLESLTMFDSTRGEVKTDNGRIGESKIFASGDIVSGDKSVVYAIKTGKIAATEIDRYLGGK